jgi:Putative transposase DNA-binding domain
LLKVPPPGTSETCSQRRHRDPLSRGARDRFCCTRCDHDQHADWNATRVIRGPLEDADGTPDPFLVKLFVASSLASSERNDSGSICRDLCASKSPEQELLAVGLEAPSFVVG